MEDMGKTSLQTDSPGSNGLLLYERVVEILLRLQVDGVGGFDTTWTCQTESYDRLVMRRYESEYFRDAFLTNYLKLKSDWSELDHSFDYLADVASKAESRFLLTETSIEEHHYFGFWIRILRFQDRHHRLARSASCPLGYDLASF